MAREQHEAGFRAAVAEHLSSYTSQLVPALRTLIEHEYPEDFWQLDFEVHAYYYDEFPVLVYFYREGFDQADSNEEGYPDGFPLNIIETGRIIPESVTIAFPEDESLDECWHWETIDEEIIKWFHSCWLAAGGDRFSHRARLASHDADKRLDLVSGEWTEDG